MGVNDDIKRFQNQVDSALNELISGKNLQEMADDLANIVRRRTRLGYVVPETNKPKIKMEPLAKSTKKSRKRIQKLGQLSDLTSANKSNLTLTGQMLDSLVGKTRNGLIEVKPDGTRNQRLAAFHIEGNSKLPSRPFLDLANEDVRQLQAKMQDAFTKILGKYFK